MTTYMRLFDADREKWDEMLNSPDWRVVEEEITYVDDHGEKTVRVVLHRIEDDTYWLGGYTEHPSHGTEFEESLCEVEPFVVMKTEFRRKSYESPASD